MIELLKGVIVPYKTRETKVALLGNIDDVLCSGISGEDIASLLSESHLVPGLNQPYQLTPRQIAELTLVMDCCQSPYTTTDTENLRVAKIQEVLEVIKIYNLKLDYTVFLGFAVFGRNEPNSQITEGLNNDPHETIPSIFNQVSHDEKRTGGFYLTIYSNAVKADRLRQKSFTVKKQDLSADVFWLENFSKGDIKINCLEGRGEGLYAFGYNPRTNSFNLTENLNEKFHVFVSDSHYKPEGN